MSTKKATGMFFFSSFKQVLQIVMFVSGIVIKCFVNYIEKQ